MTCTAYGLAKEIRLLTAKGWLATSLVARAEAGLAWSAFIRQLTDTNGCCLFVHEVSARRCDNCGISGSEEHRPRIGMMSFYDERGLLHFCDACAV